MKLLALGAAAPALVAPWTAGALETPKPAEIQTGHYRLITSAYAADTPPVVQSSYIKGLQSLIFGADATGKRYWVIAGSRKGLDEAKQYSDQLNRSDPNLKAFVGQRKAGNPYYPIVLGGPEAYLPVDQAKRLLATAIKNPLVPPDAYLSDFKERLPRVVAE